ncbi:MAG: enoyl-CoA hydratase/isomerase family protein [Deltaproteobacteria bacterium]|nr:enoyl-CoA hydratase/isomerase family protein [Deltaproteobacteria bacterium]MBW2415443.1 enoyl-CoA hydratase/isomerase family protein [Deltaproteobacteria bacterium]
MAYDGYACLSVGVTDGVAQVAIDHPPINLFDGALMGEMARLSLELEADESVRVVVFRSANPDYFIAHADVTLIQQLPTDVPPRGEALNFFHAMVDRFRTMPKVSIGVIAGRARGGGSEFLLGLDMRFAARGRAVLSQPEVALGILPGGGGTQRLPRLIGRARAAEVIFGCEDFDADLAERYGWVNRALPADEIDGFVDRLAARIASFPAEAIALAKESLSHADGDLVDGLIGEAHAFDRTLATKPAQERMQRFMELGGQTDETERDLGRFVEKLADPA